MSGLEGRVVDYALALAYGELPEKAIHHAKRRVIDTLGARIWGSLVRTSPDMAAFVNGCMLRFLDINDTYRTVDGSHPSDNLGGVLAVVRYGSCYENIADILKRHFRVELPPRPKS